MKGNNVHIVKNMDILKLFVLEKNNERLLQKSTYKSNFAKFHKE